jgi:hypothetical protein
MLNQNIHKLYHFKIVLIILSLITILLVSVLILNFNKNNKIVFASTDGFPSLIEPDPCPGYVEPTSVYNKNNPEGVKFGNTWLGNTFCGSNNNGEPYNTFTSAIGDIYVQPDGTVLTNAQFEESGKGLGAWKDGKPAWDGAFYQRATGSGNATTGDGTGNISFYPRANGGSGNTLVVGYGNSYAGSGPVGLDNAYIIGIKGMAAKNGTLFTASDNDNKIKTYSYTNPTGGLTATNQGWTIPANSTKLKFDNNGTLWLLVDPYGTNPKVIQYNTNGTQLKSMNFPSGVQPTAIAFDANNKLAVGDSGVDQQVKIYDISGTSLVQTGTFGIQYGTSADPIKGATGLLRFRGYFSGLGFDSSNNIYLSTSYVNDTTLSSYNYTSQSRNWFLESNQFQKIVSADPGSDNGDRLDMYSPNLKTQFDFSKPKGKQFNVSAQIEDFDSPFNKATKSPLLRFAYTTRVNGQKFNYLDDDNAGNTQLLIRKNTTDAGLIGVDSAAVSCDNGQLNLWRDTNNNHQKDSGETDGNYQAHLSTANLYCGPIFYWVDSNSGIWYFSGGYLLYLPLQGLDLTGNPIYTWSSSKYWTSPELGMSVYEGYQKFQYDAVRDIAVFTYSSVERHGRQSVRVVDNFLKGNKVPKWETLLPMDGCTCNFRWHTTIAGDLLLLNNNFDGTPGTPNYVNDTIINAGRTYMWNINTGAYLGHAMQDSDLFKTTNGFVDAEYQVMGYQRNNGEILNFVEDVWETKTRITQIQSPITRLSYANGTALPDKDNMGNRVLTPLAPQNIPNTIANLSATASIKEGSVSKVEFFAKDVTNSATINLVEFKLGEDTDGADGWSYAWDTSSLALGNKYQVYTRATANGTPVVNTSDPFVLQISNAAVNSSSSPTSSSSTLSTTSTTSASITSSSTPPSTTSSSSSSSSTSTTSSILSTSSSTSITSSSSGIVNTANVSKISNPLNISNTNNDFSFGISYDVNKLISGATSATDLSASFKTLWDNQNIYLSYNVTDDVVNQTGTATNGYDKDGVEIMFDLDNSKASNYDGVDDCKYSFPLIGTNELYAGSNTNCSLTGIQSSYSLINGGYRIDIKIPFSSIGVTSMGDNQRIGFDTQINDNDNGSNRESIISFNAVDSNAIWNTPSTWGEMILLPLNNTSSSASSTSINSSSSSINSDDCLI